MSDEVFSRFLLEARQKGREVAAMNHTGDDARSVIKDLIVISEQLEKALNETRDASVGNRIQQKRGDGLKLEHRELQKKLEGLRDTLTTQLTIQVKKLTTESNLINIKGTELGNAELQKSSARITEIIRRIIELITKI